jgi:peroxiredoxin (alkyl hydroperoxide reductase subunit C)
MAIKVGDKVPSAKVKVVTPDGAKDADIAELLAGKKAVVFAVPGAFTPLCSAQHLPGYVNHAAEFKAKGAQVFCVSVNDGWVMSAWGKDKSVGDTVTLIADGSANFTKAMGLEMDGAAFGLGTRSQRYAFVAKDGVVTHLAVEAPGKFEVSSAEAVLKQL